MNEDKTLTKNEKGKEIVIIETTEEINRYELKKQEYELFMSFFEEFYGENNNELSIFYNSKNTGESYKKNFLGLIQKDFENSKEIYKYAKDNNFEFCVTGGLYQENGYVGVYTTEEVYDRRANNWVNFGQDQNLFTIFTNDKKHITRFERLLSDYMNYGFQEIIIYDNFNEEIAVSFTMLEESIDEFLNNYEKTVKIYGFTRQDLEDMYWQ